MTKLILDLETRSACDLKKTGAPVYAEDPTTDVWCAAYAVDDDPVQLWTPDQPCPPEIIDAVIEGHQVVAHNYMFEKLIWQHVLAPRYGWPEPERSQWRCTMAMALAMSLPASLENAGAALGLDQQKDISAHRLMLQMSRPRRIKDDGTLVWWDEPEKRERLYAYCKQDVEAERALLKRLLPLRPSEQAVFELDGAINDRGVRVDVDLCRKAKQIVGQVTERLDREMRDVTLGDVSRCSNAQQLLIWVRSRGIDTKSLAKDQLADLLIRDDLPDDVRRALELRQEAAKTSTAKIDAMLTRRSKDGRMRGNLQYHGAGTGRWAGRGAQLQNLPRPTTEDWSEIESMLALLMTGDAEMVQMLYDRPLTAVADCIRSMIEADPGKQLYAADFSAIEARGLAWLAGQSDVLDAFRSGVDIYNHSATGIFGRPINRKVDKLEGQIGKVSILALGYQGGVGAFQAMAKSYGLKIGDHFDAIWPLATPENRERAEKGWADRGRRSGVAKNAWLAAEVIKLAWRQANPRIVEYWKVLEDAAVEAVAHPGRIVAAGRYIRFRMNGSFLWCQLPSGRCLCYPYARITEKRAPWGAMVPAITYKSVNQITRKWEDKDFYGGLSAENVTQAVCRDIMAEAMVRVENAGYPVVLTVHDEIVSERAGGDLGEFESLMTVVPDWAAGFPIAASGWTGSRYRK